MEKQKVRKPLAPIAENAKCKAQYDALLAEFAELSKLQVKDVDYISPFNSNPVVTLEEYDTRLAQYNLRRDAYNLEFDGMIETRDYVRANIRKIRDEMDAQHKEETTIKKQFEEKWGDDIPSPMPENVDLMFENPKEWGRQSEECKRQYEEWDRDSKKVNAIQRRFTDLFSALYEEECKFEDIQKEADAAFEDMARRTLADGTVMNDEQLAEYERKQKV